MRKLIWGLCLFLLLAAGGAANGQVVLPGGPDPMVGVYNTSPPTLTNGQKAYIQLDSSGRLAIPGSAASSPQFNTPAPATCTDTVRAVGTTSSTLLAAGTYKSVTYMNIGTNAMTFTEGAAAAVVGNGFALSGAQSAGLQGGTYNYPVPPTNAVQAIAGTATTVIVKVCN